MSLIPLQPIETFGNNDITTLASAAGPSDTVLTVTSVSGFPTDGQFRLLIDSELLLVTGYDSGANQFQVTRAIEGTTAASHAMSAQVVCILTKGSLVTLKQNSGGTSFVYRDSEPNPTGNVFDTFDGAYAAAQALGTPATILLDDSISQCSTGNALGFGAAYTSIVGSTATITGLLNMTPDVVGLYLSLETEGPVANNGTFPITAYLSPTSVQITNAEATLNTGYQWYLFDGLSASIETVTGASGTAATITAFATPLATISGLVNMTSAMVGQTLVLDNILQGTAATITAFATPLATISGLTNMSPVLVGQNLALNYDPEGTNASITAFDGTNATVVGLTGMSVAFVGQNLNLSGSVNSANNGSFVISAYISPTSVQITNPSAVSPDAGPINWGAQDPNNGSFVISAYISPTSVQINNPSTVFPDSSEFVWSTADPNSGSFPIAAYISPTSVQITNSSAISPDPGPLFWYVTGTSTTCALISGLAASPSLVGQTLTLTDMGQAGNNGTFLVVAYVSPTSVWINNPAAVASDSGQRTLSGTSAYISSVVPDTAGGQEIISGLTGIAPGMVGGAINVTNAFYAGPEPAPDNNGDQAILGFVSSTALRILNNPYVNACFAPDYGIGGTEESPTIDWTISEYVSVVAVQSCATVTGLANLSPADVALVLTIHNGNSSPNNGVWEIAGYISSTSVLLNNTNAVPDTNNGTLEWYVGTNYDLHQITLSTNLGCSELFLYDGATFNQGIAKIADISVYTEFNYQLYAGTFLQAGGPSWVITGEGQLQVDGGENVYDFSQVFNFFPILTLTGNAYANNIANFGTNTNSSIEVWLYDGAVADSAFAQGTGGDVTFSAYTALTQALPTSIEGYSGSFSTNYFSEAVTLTPYIASGPPSVPANSPVKVGTMYFDTNLQQAFWWNGTAWVSYTQATFDTTNVLQGYATEQTTNLGAGDHVIFNGEYNSAGGSNISLDTSTPYTTTPGAASVGRITLAEGHLFKLVANANQVSGVGNIYFQWWYTNSDNVGGVNVGNGTRLDDGTFSPDFASHGDCVAYIYTNSGSGGAVLAELRIMENSGMTSIGENAVAPLYAWFTVEQVY